MNITVLLQIIRARRNYFIAISVLILINIGLFIYYSSFLDPKVVSLQKNWSEKRLAGAGEAVKDTAAIYRQGTEDLAVWRSKIYPKKDFARFIGELFETATNKTLKVGSITYKPQLVKGDNLLAYSIGFNVSGNYAEIKNFLADIERMREIAVIDNVSLNAKSSEENVDMKLQMTAYFRVEG
jgi:type IV pilus assembly protein PilO